MRTYSRPDPRHTAQLGDMIVVAVVGAMNAPNPPRFVTTRVAPRVTPTGRWVPKRPRQTSE